MNSPSFWWGIGILVASWFTVIASQLLVAKQYDKSHIIVEQPVQVSYHLYNQDNNSIFDVEIVDDSFGTMFSLVNPTAFPLRVAEIAPKTSHVLTITVQPASLGNFADQPAIITYRRSEVRSDGTTNTELQSIKGRSTALGLQRIISQVEYNTFVKSHLREWWVFMAGAALVVVLPYYRYKQALDSLQS